MTEDAAFLPFSHCQCSEKKNTLKGLGPGVSNIWSADQNWPARGVQSGPPGSF